MYVKHVCETRTSFENQLAIEMEKSMSLVSNRVGGKASGVKEILKSAYEAVSRSSVVCADGLTLSVQANCFVECYPKKNRGDYQSVQCEVSGGFVSEFEGYISRMSSDGARYALVPIPMLAFVIEKHGGRSDTSWSMKSMSGGCECLEGFSHSCSSESLWSHKQAVIDCGIWMQAVALGSPKQAQDAKQSISKRMGDRSWDLALKNFNEVINAQPQGRFIVEEIAEKWGALCFKDWEYISISASSIDPSKKQKRIKSI